MRETTLCTPYAACALAALLLSSGCAAPDLAEGGEAAGDVATPGDGAGAADTGDMLEDGPAWDAVLQSSTLYIVDYFDYSTSLITNEYATYNPNDASAVRSDLWKMTSGTLFHRTGTGWTGEPDGDRPDRYSQTANGSAVFRMVSQRDDLKNVSVLVTLQNNAYTTTDRTPAHSWDGIHLFLRYVSEESLYYVSVNRRDDVIVIKKKVPGGPSNGGTYYSLTGAIRYTVPQGKWQWFRASVRTLSSGSVRIELKDRYGNLLAAVTDDGSVGGPPILSAGRVGVRGDNCNFRVGRLIASSL